MIELVDFGKRYGKQIIFDQVKYTFRERGLICLLGESGCGKTTLFNLLAGFDTDYEGQLSVGGSNLKSMSSDELCQYRRDNIGFVFQNYHLLPGYSVYENIQLAVNQNKNDEEMDQRIKELIGKVGLSDKLHEKIEHLSGGQKQRVAIVRALINEGMILLADEPTGALDHENALAIMELLKEIAKDHLVLVITHDASLCEHADEVLRIEDAVITSNQQPQLPSQAMLRRQSKPASQPSFPRAWKNFKLHVKAYFLVAMAIAIGATLFILSLSSSNLLESSINEFKEKNTAFQNGQITIEEEEKDLFERLQEDTRIEHVYYQYVVHDITLSNAYGEVQLPEKYPMKKLMERMSYGVMPRNGKAEIALSPSLAKNFSSNLEQLIGQKLRLSYKGKMVEVEVSGIYGAAYDDFYISSDIEQTWYQGMEEETPFSISFDVLNFEDIVPVYEMLKEDAWNVSMSYQEVGALQATFENLQSIFLFVSLFILCVACLLSVVLMMKMQRARIREVGLLSALGYFKKQIQKTIFQENFLLILLAMGLNIGCLFIAYFLCMQFEIVLDVTGIQILVSLLTTSILVLCIGAIGAYPLLKVEPAKALRA